MAEAVLERFPEAKIAIGPPIEDGFYYDFDLPSGHQRGRHQMGREAHEKDPVTAPCLHHARSVSPDEARAQFFTTSPTNLELIDDLVNGRLDDNGNPISAPADSLTVYYAEQLH